MSTRDFKVKDGDEILIEVARAKKNDSLTSRSAAQKAMIPVRLRDEYFARRLTPGLKIFDLGIKKDVGGNWIDNQFHAPVTYTDDDQSPISAAAYLAKAEEIIRYDKKTLDDTFFQIKKENIGQYKMILRLGAFPNNNVGLNEDSDLWSNDGNTLKFKDENKEKLGVYFELFMNPFFAPVEITNGESNCKITEVPEYGADAVVLNLKGSETVYLTPVFTLMRSFVSGNLENVPVAESDPEGSFNESLLANYWSYPRVYLADLFEWFQPFFGTFHSARNETNTVENYTKWWFWTRYLKTLSPRDQLFYYYTYTYEDTEAGQIITRSAVQKTIADAGNFPKHLFPAPPLLPAPETDNYDGAHEYRAGAGYSTGFGDLIAMVKQGSRFFYVWWNTDS